MLLINVHATHLSAMKKPEITKPNTQTPRPIEPPPSNYLYVITVQTLSPIFAPKLNTFYGPVLDQLLDVLKKKYGEDKVKHIDRAFLRMQNPVTGKTEIKIMPSTIYGAFKIAMNRAGQPLDDTIRVLGMFFPENAVSLFIRSLITAEGKKTMCYSEIVTEGSNGMLIFLGEPPEYLKTIKTIAIGWRKKKGFGVVRILWNEVVRVELK